MFIFIQKFCVLVGVASLTCACTTLRAPSETDPLEGLNRSVDAFNQGIDRAVIKPLAQGYDRIIPPEIKTVIGNFFSNLDEPSVALNNLLQGKPRQAGSDITRFLLNTTLGLMGLVDVATELGFQKNDEDFGQTLGAWGISSGPYLVLPFFGPTTVRDAPTRFVEAHLDPLYYNDDMSVRNSLFAANVINTRARLLPATDLVERIALDQYAFVRDAYLNRRASLVRDGAPDPADRQYEDFEDESQSELPEVLMPLTLNKAIEHSVPDEPQTQHTVFAIPADFRQDDEPVVGLMN